MKQLNFVKGLFLFILLCTEITNAQTSTNSKTRDPRAKDIANVFWDGTYPLYSKFSDEEIKPDANGIYTFWYATNENHTPREIQMPAREFTVYKFKTYQECVAWVESKFHEKIDGNIYSKNNTGTVVKIGSQVWMTKNLNIDRFRNGDLIPEIKTNEEWKYACDNNLPACRYYNNDPVSGENFGRIYNWYAVNDSRGLAPKGWHIPSQNEWRQLIDFLGENQAGTKMKSTSGWQSNGNGTNESGFNGCPDGFCFSDGVFSSIGGMCNLWSSSETSANTSSSINLKYSYGYVGINNFEGRGNGIPVRCVQDDRTMTQSQTIYPARNTVSKRDEGQTQSDIREKSQQDNREKHGIWHCSSGVFEGSEFIYFNGQSWKNLKFKFSFKLISSNNDEVVLFDKENNAYLKLTNEECFTSKDNQNWQSIGKGHW